MKCLVSQWPKPHLGCVCDHLDAKFFKQNEIVSRFLNYEYNVYVMDISTRLVHSQNNEVKKTWSPLITVIEY